MRKQNSYVLQDTQFSIEDSNLNNTFDTSQLTSLRRQYNDYNQHKLLYTNNNQQNRKDSSQDSVPYSSHKNVNGSLQWNEPSNSDTDQEEKYNNINFLNFAGLEDMRIDYENAELPALPTNDHVNDENNSKPYENVNSLSVVSKSFLLLICN